MQPIYTIYDLASESGASVWTIKRWIVLKLVPPAEVTGDNMVRYTDIHLKRINRVRDWIDAQVTLSELAERIEYIGERALDVPDPYAGMEWDDDDE